MASFYFLFKYQTHSFEFINKIMNGRHCRNINTGEFLLKFSDIHKLTAFYITVIDEKALYLCTVISQIQTQPKHGNVSPITTRKPSSDKVCCGQWHCITWCKYKITTLHNLQQIKFSIITWCHMTCWSENEVVTVLYSYSRIFTPRL